MLFNSFHFLVFLPVVLLVYYLVPHRVQNRFLLLASCYFYASWDWRFLLPLLASTSIDYYSAWKMEQLGLAGEPKSKLRPYLILSLVTNLALLGFFKYFNFFVQSAQDMAAMLGIPLDPWTLKVILPVGISFYTFQALSYTIDVYRGQFHATRSFTDFLLAVLYFPHLVAGPIQRAHSLLPQVVQPRVVTREKILSGIHLMIWGFFKKVYIADNLAPVANQAFTASTPDGFQVWMGVYAFAFQIYCDFSGYTDIARGVARLMGFEFMLNFNLPYLTTNPRDFWNRWHISLSSWLRDYLYIPLGGSRDGKLYRNLMLTMVIGGFWHGAAWNFVLWGFYQGSVLILHRMWEGRLEWVNNFSSAGARRVSFWVQVLLMFQVTCYGWLIFRAASLSQIWQMTGALADFGGWKADWSLAAKVLTLAAPVIVVQLIQYFTKQLEFITSSRLIWQGQVALYALAMYMVLFHGGQPEAFIYFQF